MPSNVEMSLDEIIKANKSKDKAVKKVASKGNKSGVRGKRVANQPQKNRLQRAKPANASGKLGAKKVNSKPGKTTAIATKRLVQKLVKKALAQTNVRTPVRRTLQQRPKFRGGRVVKKTVVVNRLKLNPRSRVISRRPRINTQKVFAVRGRGQIRYNPNLDNGQQIVRRVNYLPSIVTKPVLVRTIPRNVVQTVRRQRQVPVYQTTNVVRNSSSVRDHILRLRTGGVARRQVPQQVVYVQQQRPLRQQQRKQNFQRQRGNFQQQRPRQQRQNNFARQQFKTEPFFEPPNFLQRVPVQTVVSQNRVGGRRY